MSAATVPAASRTVSLRYDRKSEVRFDGTRSDVIIALDAVRAAQSSAPRPVLTGRVRDEALLRDALATLFIVRDSDLRYAGKDRSAYLAYLLAKGKRAGAGVWEAQKAMITREIEGDTAAVEGCDPVLTIDDEAAFEVFSRDESAYARLSFPLDFFEDRKVSPGTGFFQAHPALLPAVSRLRSYLPLHLDIGVGDAQDEPIERTATVAAGWLKSFLQVQSAAMLPATTCEIAPVDLYNILYVLSIRRAKKAPRALRFELLPGKKPRIVIEPFGVVLETHGAPYTGSKPMVIRTYGRQRLLALSRLLSHVSRVRISLLGPGLPVFWILELEGNAQTLDDPSQGRGIVPPKRPAHASLTLGFTGWTDSSWSSAATFDQLVPPANASTLAERVIAELEKSGALSLATLTKTLGSSAEKVRAALQRCCLRGEVVLDVARDVFRRRPLFATPVEDEVTRAATPREVRALRFLETKGAVTITKEHTIAGQGLEICGEVKDIEARRSYAPRFTVDLEGRVTEASCNCITFVRSALREGPCEHMLALRTAYARERAAAEALRDTPEGRAKIRAETRTLTRRDARGAEETCKISLDGKRVRLGWVLQNAGERYQTLDFDAENDAREEYFNRLGSLAEKGFIDAGDLGGDGASPAVA